MTLFRTRKPLPFVFMVVSIAIRNLRRQRRIVEGLRNIVFFF
ncbi:MAG: hypothetical protein ABFC65_00750 [Rectinema sp.]